MKVWNNYGSEHSMNLVMIGEFKTVDEAKDALHLIEHLTEDLEGKVEVGREVTKFSHDVLDVIVKHNLNVASASELQQLFNENYISIEGNKIILKTEEVDVSLFLKILVSEGAKVEVYSGHSYPDEEYGRGK